MADVRHWNDPPEGFPATVISRVIIHVDGSPGAGKTTFVERLLGAVDDWALGWRPAVPPILNGDRGTGGQVAGRRRSKRTQLVNQ